MKTHTDWAAVGAPDWLGEERLLEQFLDSENHVGEKFFLYYFVNDLTNTKPLAAKPTLLFVAGGPGEINRVRNENFGDLAGYRIVYFHLRGAGFSQLPSNKSYDKYLRGRYAVEDMEAIRRDLLGERGKWHGIVGHSYGTVLAQQYAHRYSEHVGKLVLSASLSRHQLQTIDEAPQIEESLTRIYQSERFAFLDYVKSPNGQDTRSFLVASAMTIADRGEQQFGNLQFVVDEYPQIQSHLRAVGLNHSRKFFAALRRLRHVGWLYHSGDLAKGASDNVDEVQQYTGLIIAKEIFMHAHIDFEQPLNSQRWSLLRFDTPNSRNKYAERATSTLIKNAKEYFKAARASSHRAYYVMSIFDGICVTFLQEYLAHGDVRKAIRKIGGLQHEENDVNPFLDTVGITDEPITPWDPRNYPHKVPTLILKGGADPVTRGDQAERYLTDGLTGERMLMEFSGVGHSMSLPEMVGSKSRSGGQTRDFLLRYFFEDTFKKFNASGTISVMRKAFAKTQINQPNKRYGAGVKATFIAGENAVVKL